MKSIGFWCPTALPHLLDFLITEFLFLMTLHLTSRNSLWLSFKSSWLLILGSSSCVRISHSYFISLF